MLNFKNIEYEAKNDVGDEDEMNSFYKLHEPDEIHGQTTKDMLEVLDYNESIRNALIDLYLSVKVRPKTEIKEYN